VTTASDANPASGKPTVWPVVVGILSLIAVGVDVLINLVWLALSTPAMARGSSGISSFDIARLVLALVLAGVLLAGALMLLRRSASALPAYLIYASGSVILRCVAFVMAVVSHEWSALSATYATGGITGMALALAFPVFCLVWFLRGSIRREMRGWYVPSAEPARPTPRSAASGGAVVPGTLAPPPGSLAEAEAVRLQFNLETRLKHATGWIGTIGIVTIIQLFLTISGSGVSFPGALGLPAVIAHLGHPPADAANMSITMTSVLGAVLFFILSASAKKRSLHAFVLAMALYSVDTVVTGMDQQWVNAGFHVLALIFISRGLMALRQLLRASRQKVAAGDK
jgi:hypothetical protein